MLTHNYLHPPKVLWANRSSKSTRRDQRTGFRYALTLLLYSITLYILFQDVYYICIVVLWCRHIILYISIT